MFLGLSLFRMIRTILVLGGGSAGLMAAVTLKRRLPALDVKIVRSPEIGIIAVGEGTTVSFPKLFFEYLKLQPKSFYEMAEPTWKLGIRFLWGPRKEFFYSFGYEFQHRYPDLSRDNGFYSMGADESTPIPGPLSAYMSLGKAFPKQPDGLPQVHNHHGYHIENKKLVDWLVHTARALGVGFIDATVTAERGEKGIEALVTDDGKRLTADLYVDASGFRSELLGGVLGEPHISYKDTLFCDRAVIAGWPRTDEPILPYTTAETMDAGWCWQIEHETFINRGYVYSSSFISDEAALEEFRRKNPLIATEPRIVKFRSGRFARSWVGNVVGIGNAVGFVEPLEATSLQVICLEASSLADSLIDSLCEPTPSLVAFYNVFNGQAWDDIRDFLAVHYAFNTRLDTPFWVACRNDTQLHGARPIVDFYRENGPSKLAAGHHLHSANSFGMDGYLALLLGQNVPHGKRYVPTAREADSWRTRSVNWMSDAKRGLDVRQSLDALRKRGFR